MPTIMTLPTSGRRGQLRTLINSGLRNPTALTINFNMGGRLFWVDEYRNVIESCKPDGSDRTVMYSGTDGKLTHCDKVHSNVCNVLQGGPKKWTPNALHKTSSNMADFKKYFTVTISRKFAMQRSLTIPPHLKRVATLPCEMFVSEN